MELPTVTQIREIATRHGVSPSRALGQNFVIDPNTIRKVIKLADVKGDDLVVEVGPGLGALTVGLSEAASQVMAIELDRHLLAPLSEVLVGRDNVTVIHRDAMSYDFSSTFGGEPHRFISNLPYNIATPLIANILDRNPQVEDLVVMVQREAGERLVAPPGSRTYGAVSVLVAYHCEGSILAKIPSSVFWPPPNVESVLVRLTRRPSQVDVDPGSLMEVVRASFSQRRKTVRNSLSSSLGIEPKIVEDALERANIPEAARAESLGLSDFARLTNSLEGSAWK